MLQPSMARAEGQSRARRGGLGCGGARGDIQQGANLLLGCCLPLPSHGAPRSTHGPWARLVWAGDRAGGGRLPEGEEGSGGCCLFCSGASLRAKRQQQLSARRSKPGSLLISTPTCSAGRGSGCGVQGSGLHQGGPGAY